MEDPWNPSYDDVRAWAYDPDTEEPCQDWELALTWSCHETALLEAASDERCPKRKYMLGVLYYIVGYFVGSGMFDEKRPIIEGFVARGDDYPHPDIHLWQERARDLFRAPETYSYEQWRGGGLLKQNDP